MPKSLDKNNGLLTTPLNHLALILDGNRRWAKAKGLTASQGHKAGADNILELVKLAIKHQIKELSLYTFSTENWKRDKSEINFIFASLKNYLIKYQSSFKKYDIRLEIVGSRKELKPDLVKLINTIEKNTKQHKTLKLNLMFNYGGVIDLESGIKKTRAKTLKALRQASLSANVSDVDLLIRTGGEIRLSNFLPLQLAYAELYFTKTYWPDFKAKQLQVALKEYQMRQRRYGGD